MAGKGAKSSFFVGCFLLSLLLGQQKTVALVGAKIFPVSAPAIGCGVLLIQSGRIFSFGDSLQIPEDAEIVNCSGFSITPGFINIIPSKIGRESNFRWGITTAVTERGNQIILNESLLGYSFSMDNFSTPDVIQNADSMLVFFKWRHWNDANSTRLLTKISDFTPVISYSIPDWTSNFELPNNAWFCFSEILFSRDAEFFEEINLPEYFNSEFGNVVLSGKWGEKNPANLLRHARMLHRYGLSEDELLQYLCIQPAILLGVDHRIGSIEEGKLADLVIFNGPPMSLRSQIVATYKNGRLQYEYE